MGECSIVRCRISIVSCSFSAIICCEGDGNYMEEGTQKTAASQYELGQSLSDLSVDEIVEIIERLKSEITRLDAAMANKQDHLTAAEALFSKK